MFRYEDTASKTIGNATLKELAEQLKTDIDEFCVKEFTDEHRHHLGASIIDKECAREVWYDFRWVKFQIYNGRVLRLFDRGHLEEARFIKLLRGIGCTIWEVDPETGKQFRIYGVQGHYGGSADSVGIIPYFPDLPMLLEFKTHNTKSFVNLVNKGVILAKPMHYSQMCNYGKNYQFKYGMYIAVNKNDDDLHIEIVPLDWNRANDLDNKAFDIITATIPPARIAENPSYYACKMCSKAGVCWEDEPVDINCRSCKMATPVENAEWHCAKFDQIIPREFLNKGCDQHEPITK